MKNLKRLMIASASMATALSAPAHATKFSNTWSFVDQRTGKTISGTLDGLSNGVNLGASSLTVTVTSAPFASMLGAFNINANPDGPYHFYSAVNGVVTFANFVRYGYSRDVIISFSTSPDKNRFPSLYNYDTNKFVWNQATGMSFAAVQAAVPEPVTWAMMILGMGAVGFAMRRKTNVGTTVRFA